MMEHPTRPFLLLKHGRRGTLQASVRSFSWTLSSCTHEALAGTGEAQPGSRMTARGLALPCGPLGHHTRHTVSLPVGLLPWASRPPPPGLSKRIFTQAASLENRGEQLSWRKAAKTLRADDPSSPLSTVGARLGGGDSPPGRGGAWVVSGCCGPIFTFKAALPAPAKCTEQFLLQHLLLAPKRHGPRLLPHGS